MNKSKNKIKNKRTAQQSYVQRRPLDNRLLGAYVSFSIRDGYDRAKWKSVSIPRPTSTAVNKTVTIGRNFFYREVAQNAYSRESEL